MREGWQGERRFFAETNLAEGPLFGCGRRKELTWEWPGMRMSLPKRVGQEWTKSGRGFFLSTQELRRFHRMSNVNPSWGVCWRKPLWKEPSWSMMSLELRWRNVGRPWKGSDGAKEVGAVVEEGLPRTLEAKDRVGRL